MKKIIALAFFLPSLFIATRSFAQFDDLDDIMKGSKADASYLAEGYLRPFMNSISSGLNQGWYNTAANHKKLGFDFTVSASLIYFPTSDQFYKVDNTKLTNLKMTYPATFQAPTIFGPDNQATNPVYDYKSGPSLPFPGPPGLDPKKNFGVNAIPLPIANLGIGLPWNTDLKIRYLPNIGIGKTGGVSMFGVGVLHDIKQHIPGIKMVPFDLSVLVGYTSFKADIGLNDARPDQKVSTQFTTTTVQALIGKKFSVITLYGAAGFNFGTGKLNVKGTFPDATTGLSLVDPVSLSSSVSGPRVTAGARLKLAIFTFHADYTLQKYNTLTVGFGLAVR